MVRSFTTLDGKTYTVSTCAAVALNAGDTEPQPALYVVSAADSGETFEFIVYGWNAPETIEDFAAMAEDFGAWDSDYEAVATAVFDAKEREDLENTGVWSRKRSARSILDHLTEDQQFKLAQAYDTIRRRATAAWLAMQHAKTEEEYNDAQKRHLDAYGVEIGFQSALYYMGVDPEEVLACLPF